MDIIAVENIVTRFGAQEVHKGISFGIEPGSVVALIGGSGSGKSTLLREMIGLLPPTAGTVRLFGIDIWNTDLDTMSELRHRFGVLFQNGALYSALTCGENIAVPLVEQAHLPEDTIRHLVQLRLGLTGLTPDVALKMPSELSGGMRKRVALARALALEPELLFLDEPTSGLDPINARAFDSLIRTLCDSLGLTIFMVTHDLDSIESIADRLIVLDQGKVLADGPVPEVARVDHPWIQEYFSSRATAEKRAEKK